MRGLVVTYVLLAGLFVSPPPVRGQDPEPVVHALLFYSRTCPHCHEVINQLLLPMQEQYGSRLVILGFDTTQPVANDLYQAAVEHYEIGPEDWVVPILVVDTEVMIGGGEIPDRFPGIVEAGLAGGGIDLPEFPAVISLLEEQGGMDGRFPDRRIALQNPPVGVRPTQEAPDSTDLQPEEDPPSEDPSSEDLPREAQPSDAEPAATDSAQAAVDTVEADPSQTEGDTVPSPTPEQGGVPETVASPDPAGEASDAAEGGERGAEEDPSVGPEPETRAEVTPAQGPMGLAEAARELESMTMWDRFKLDPAGNSLAVLVLLFMVVSLLLKGYPPRAQGTAWPTWVVPALLVVGFGVAAYLSYIEVTQVDAVCGPVGDCNTVNQSSYATLFGVLPVGVLGLMGYAVLQAFWVLEAFGPENLRAPAALGAWAAALFGVVFSLYLTFLEPFVIGATCAWCLTSALVMTFLLWAWAPLARDAWPVAPDAGEIQGGGSNDV